MPHVLTSNLGVTGSVEVSQVFTAPSFTGSLYGTASWARSADDAFTASYALSGGSTDTGSFYISSSITDATVAFTRADNNTDFITVNNVANADLATVANDAITASFTLTASYALNGGNGGINTGSFYVGSSAVDDTVTFTKADGSVDSAVVNNIESSSFAQKADYIQGMPFQSTDLVVLSKINVFNSLPNNSRFILYNPDGSVADFAVPIQGQIPGPVGNTSTTSTTVGISSQGNSCTMTATVNSIYNASYGIGRMFIAGLDHAVYGPQNGVITFNNFTNVVGYLPNRFRFRGRFGAEYYTTCRWVVTYTDGTSETRTTTVGSQSQYHDYAWNSDGSRTLQSVLCDLTGIVGGNPGVSSFEPWFPNSRAQGFYLKQGTRPVLIAS